MRHRIAFISRFAISAFKQSALLTGVSLWMVCCVLADDIAVSEQNFSCINDWPKIRNTHIYNADTDKLNEAIRIFRDSVSDTEYPVGTILQLIPTEAMVKHSRGAFAKSNDWEFFSLDVAAAGTRISERGENVVNHTQGLTCLSPHQMPSDDTQPSDRKPTKQTCFRSASCPLYGAQPLGGSSRR